jgi:uncharacterized protein YjbI with pentapeptide repeats
MAFVDPSENPGDAEKVDVCSRWEESHPDQPGTRRDVILQELNDASTNDTPLDLRSINLAGEDLSGLNFARCDLSGADLSKANLCGANLSWANLEGAKLSHACLDDCEMLGADLKGAVLNECSAERAGFGGADLSGASLIGAKLRQATLTKSKLHKADFRAATLVEARITESDCSEANFTRANIQEADLKASDFRDANLELADLRKARLLGIRNFATASWIGADIRGVDLRGAYLVRRHIDDQNYLYEFRTKSRYYNMIYWVWWATSDCGRSATRWAFSVLAVALVFAFLYSFIGVDFGDHETPLSPIYFSFVTLTTLGYGDIVPDCMAGQVLAMIEAVLGYVGLGGLLSIFSNKMARRAE